MLDKSRQLDAVRKQEREFRKELEEVRRKLREDDAAPGQADNLDPDGLWEENWDQDWNALFSSPIKEGSSLPAPPAPNDGAEATLTKAEREGVLANAEDAGHAAIDANSVEMDGEELNEDSPFAFLDRLSDEDNRDRALGTVENSGPTGAAPMPTRLEDSTEFLEASAEPSDAEETPSTWETLDDLDVDEPPAAAPSTPELGAEEKQALESLVAQEPLDLKRRSQLSALQKRQSELQQRVESLETRMRGCGETWDWTKAPEDGGELEQLQQQWRAASLQRRSATESLDELRMGGTELAAEAAALSEHAPPGR